VEGGVSAKEGLFRAKLSEDHPLPEGVWTQVRFDQVVEDVGGMYDPEAGVFVAQRDMRIGFEAGFDFLVEVAVMSFAYEAMFLRNGQSDRMLWLGRGTISVGGSEGTPSSSRWHGSSYAQRRTPVITARAGDAFTLHGRHDVGATLFLSAQSIFPEFPEHEGSHISGRYEFL
jgi:hypothetical protein